MRTLINPLAVFVIAVITIVIAPSQANAARLIHATVYYNDVVVLEGTTSDNGRIDADGVWDYLKAIKFKPTDAFQTLKIDPAAKRADLSGGGRGVALSDCKITVSIGGGGKAKFRKLTLIRVLKDAQGREWTLGQTEIDDMFKYRLISRRDAASLRRPGKLKP